MALDDTLWSALGLDVSSPDQISKFDGLPLPDDLPHAETVGRTCERCHLQKLSCSKTSPCERCNRLGHACVAWIPRKRGRKVKAIPELNNYEVATKSARLEDHVPFADTAGEVPELVPTLADLQTESELFTANRIMTAALAQTAEVWKQRRAVVQERVSHLLIEHQMQQLNVDATPAAPVQSDAHATTTEMCPFALYTRLFRQVALQVRDQQLRSQCTQLEISTAEEWVQRVSTTWRDETSCSTMSVQPVIRATTADLTMLDAVIETLPIAALICVLDTQDPSTVRHSVANEVAAKYLGYSCAELRFLLRRLGLSFMLSLAQFEDVLHHAPSQASLWEAAVVADECVFKTNIQIEQKITCRIRTRAGEDFPARITMKFIMPLQIEIYFVPLQSPIGLADVIPTTAQVVTQEEEMHKLDTSTIDDRGCKTM